MKIRLYLLPFLALTLLARDYTLTVVDGVITMTPNAYKGIAAAETCVMTPVADTNDRLQWTYSGSCVDKGYVKN